MSYTKQGTKSVAAMLLGSVCMLALSGWRTTPIATPSPQGIERRVFVAPQGRLHPVSVEQVTVAGQMIQPGVMAVSNELRPGTPFQAGEDWLKNMSFVLKNRTNKNIVWAEITLYFPETGDGRTLATAETNDLIELGQRPEIDSYASRGQKIQKDLSKQPLLLAPGQTLVIHVAEYMAEIKDRLEQFPGLLAGKPPLPQVTRVVIQPDRFFFEDGMRWTELYGFGIPDVHRPGQFVNMERGRYFPGRSEQNWPPANAPTDPLSEP